MSYERWPSAPEALAKHIVQMNRWDLEAWFNGTIHALAQAGVFGAKMTGMVDATSVQGRGWARVRIGMSISHTGSRPALKDHEEPATTQATASTPEPCEPTGIKSAKVASA